MKNEIVFLLASLSMGGAERVACSLANWIVNNTKSNVTILMIGKEKPAYQIDKKINIVRFESDKDKSRIRNIIDRLRFCKHSFKKINPNIVFAMFPKTELYGLMFKPKHSVLIGSERCNINELNFCRKILSKLCSKKCDGFIFQTERIKKYYPKTLALKSTVIYNAMSNDKVLNLKYDNIEKENIITAMGRLDVQKGFDVLIKSFKKVSESHSNYKLLIFGDGAEKSRLEMLIKEMKLNDKVILCGNDPNAIYTIAKSKVFVLSSRYEGMPNALIEAMSSGTACVATDCDFGPRELIKDGATGILVPVNDIETLSNTIIYLIENESLRKNIEREKIKIKEKLDTNIIFNQYYEYFIKVLFNKKEKTKTSNFIYRILCSLDRRGLLKFLPDKLYLKLFYFFKMGYRLNLKEPITFNEKLQWLKLYDRKLFYSKLVDKYDVRDYVTSKIGKEYLIPLIGKYERFEDIDFEKLPNQFVIKCTHDSGSVIICKDKNNFNIDKAKEKINESMKKNYYYLGREWPYKNVKPRIIIEKFMNDKEKEEINDYKFFVFNGKMKFYIICSDRSKSVKFTFFDRKNEFIKISQCDCEYDKNVSKPINFKKMIKLSEKLAGDIPQLRVDFYEINNKIYFGELTFFDSSGFGKFEPEVWDVMIGKMLNLPKK